MVDPKGGNPSEDVGVPSIKAAPRPYASPGHYEKFQKPLAFGGSVGKHFSPVWDTSNFIFRDRSKSVKKPFARFARR